MKRNIETLRNTPNEEITEEEWDYLLMNYNPDDFMSLYEAKPAFKPYEPAKRPKLTIQEGMDYADWKYLDYKENYKR